MLAQASKRGARTPGYENNEQEQAQWFQAYCKMLNSQIRNLLLSHRLIATVHQTLDHATWWYGIIVLRLNIDNMERLLVEKWISHS